MALVKADLRTTRRPIITFLVSSFLWKLIESRTFGRINKAVDERLGPLAEEVGDLWAMVMIFAMCFLWWVHRTTRLDEKRIRWAPVLEVVKAEISAIKLIVQHNRANRLNLADNERGEVKAAQQIAGVLPTLLKRVLSLCGGLALKSERAKLA